MPKVFTFTGSDDFCPGGSIYPNTKEAGLFLSLGHQVDPYFPIRKRSRFSVPFDLDVNLNLNLSGEWFEKKQKTSIESLPDECLFEILRRLPAGQDRGACASVSKRWLMLLSNICKNEICSNGSTKAENEGDDREFEDEGYLTRSLEGKKATDVRLAAIAVGTTSRGGLGKLSIRGCNSDRLTDAGLKAVAHGCPSLKIFSLWDVATVGDEGLIEIASGCRQLERLDLCKCPSISDKALIAVAKNCPNLTDLSIESCPKIGNEGLQAIGKACPNLKSVSIKHCLGVGDQGVAALLSSTSFFLTKVKLEALMISDLSLALIGHYGFAVTDLVLNYLPNVSEKGFWVMGNAHGLQKLTSLTIGNCQGVTDTGIEAIGNGCPNVKSFQLRKCPFLSDNGLVLFAKAAPSIESLQLEECHRISQYGLIGLVLNCGAKLKALTLVGCFGIKNLNFELPALSPCGSISSLSIRDCPGFGDATLAAFGKLCPQLQNVELSRLQGVTDAGFVSLIENSKTGLAKLNLSGCINLTDRAVSFLVESRGQTLEVLNLDGCKNISDATLMAVAGKCPVLSDLDVSKCAITDAGIAALARGNQHNLEILSLSGCSLVTDKCVPSLKKLGHVLVGLNIQRCNKISSRAIDRLLDHLWRCDILS